MIDQTHIDALRKQYGITPPQGTMQSGASAPPVYGMSPQTRSSVIFGTPQPKKPVQGTPTEGGITGALHGFGGITGIPGKMIAAVKDAGQHAVDTAMMGAGHMQHAMETPASPTDAIKKTGEMLGGGAEAGIGAASSALQSIWSGVTATMQQVAESTGVHPLDTLHTTPVGLAVEKVLRAHPEAASNVADVVNILGNLVGAKGIAKTPAIRDPLETPVGDIASGVKDAVAPTAQKVVHPIDTLRGYADSAQRAAIQTDVANLLKATRAIGNKAGQAAKLNTDLQAHLSDPQVFQGIKVVNGKIAPDDAIATVQDRIDQLMNAKRAMLPKIDQLVPTTPKGDITERAIANIKGKYPPKDEADLIVRIKQQMAAVPDDLKPSDMDTLRAQMRQSARDAKGQMKSDSEYAALENASRDTLFDVTDNLPIADASDYKLLNDYVKQMITTKDFLDKTLRNQVVKGGRVKGYSLKLMGAIAGSSHGPLGTLAGHAAGGLIADLIVNNQLGSSIKMALIKNLTDDPEILARAQQLLGNIHETMQPMLPPGNPANAHPDINNGQPIQVGTDGPKEYVGPETRVGGNYQSPNPGNI